MSAGLKAVAAIVKAATGDLKDHVRQQAQGLLEQVGEGASLPPPPSVSASVLSSPRSGSQSLYAHSPSQGPQRELTTTQRMLTPAHLLEASALAAALYVTSGSVDAEPLLAHLRNLLVPRSKGKSTRSPSKTEPKGPDGNTHVFVLRCLSLLPSAVWQPGLRDEHFSVIMGGTESSDPTIRRAVSCEPLLTADIRHSACWRARTHHCLTQRWTGIWASAGVTMLRAGQTPQHGRLRSLRFAPRVCQIRNEPRRSSPVSVAYPKPWRGYGLTACVCSAGSCAWAVPSSDALSCRPQLSLCRRRRNRPSSLRSRRWLASSRVPVMRQRLFVR